MSSILDDNLMEKSDNIIQEYYSMDKYYYLVRYYQKGNKNNVFRKIHYKRLYNLVNDTPLMTCSYVIHQYSSLFREKTPYGKLLAKMISSFSVEDVVSGNMNWHNIFKKDCVEVKVKLTVRTNNSYPYGIDIIFKVCEDEIIYNFSYKR